MKTLTTTNGYKVKLDDKDYERFSSINWYYDLGSGGVITTTKKYAPGTNTSKLSRAVLNTERGMYVHFKDDDNLNMQRDNLVESRATKRVHRGKKTYKRSIHDLNRVVLPLDFIEHHDLLATIDHVEIEVVNEGEKLIIRPLKEGDEN